MEITIGVVTYNQEKLVLQTLESIKYQIQNHGRRNNYTLIVADDGSVDFTIRNIQFWLNQNKGLFYKEILLCDGKNRGTAKNFVKMLEKVDSEYFKVIAGDDLLCYNDLKIYFEKLESYDIVTSCAFGIKGSTVYSLTDNYSYFTSRKQCDLRKRIRKENYFILSETIYSSRLITEDLKRFLIEFDLIEDHPMLVKFFENQKVKCTFLDDPMALYRVSESSVSRSEKLRQRYMRDKIRLEQYLIVTGKNNFDILYHKIKCSMWKIKNKKMNPLYYISKIKYLYRKFYGIILNRKKIKKIKKNLNEYQKYYDNVVHRANEVLVQIAQKYNLE